MLIKQLSVSGLERGDQNFSVSFNNDLNILTGKNGSGKTRALKVLWYIISGHIGQLVSEISFSKATLITTEYKVVINASGGSIDQIVLTRNDEERTFEYYIDQDGDEFGDPAGEASEAIRDLSTSVFFPTFRRIEGGFSIRSPMRGAFAGFAQPRPVRSQNALEEAMQDLSRRLSSPNHTFVSSISTVDIVQLLLRNYTDMSERSNALQQATSQQIIDQIKNYKREKAEVGPTDDPDKILDDIRNRIELLDKERENILAPLNAVRDLAVQLFQHAGIRLGTRLSFGDAANAVNSETLSAGEKQMLSFICYNAFYKNSVIFIDEPELSLHVDWQRQLFSIMQEQGSENQFVIATHSPFIYGKFPDKEIVINEDRGDASGMNP
jgi:predicted ATP-dependent endonuclease of OLD family